jgi:CRISPR/Cas system-associated exonuclease Cas4 (RecB family)
MILSSSSLGTYLSCSYRWRLEYILRVPPQPTEEMQTGIFVHEAIEKIINGEDATGPEPFVSAFRSHILPTLPEPRMAEWPFTIRINGVDVSGVIDCIAGTEVHDFKTTNGGRFRATSYRLQLSIYAMAYRAHFGMEPSALVIDRLDVSGRTSRHVVKPSYEEVVDVLEIVRDGVQNGHFEPTGRLNGACHWCSVRSACEYRLED